MPIIGFSTGALARGDFRRGLTLIRQARLRVVEFSALRENELEPLVSFLSREPLDGFEYASIHAPSALDRLAEDDVAAMLGQTPSTMPIILHPDAIRDWNLWTPMGQRVCIENMDQRKTTGRTCVELEKVFANLPQATFCLDVAHAAQVDPTMCEARLMLRTFGNRLCQVHVSSLDGMSSHRPLDRTSQWAYGSILRSLPPDVPWILESVVSDDRVGDEVEFARAMAS